MATGRENWENNHIKKKKKSEEWNKRLEIKGKNKQGKKEEKGK